MTDQVVLVDEADQELGLSDKTDAHLCPGMLHRAISILLYRPTIRGTELLICQRSDKKERWPLFWTNPVCSHPKPQEGYIEACVRRLKEELGIRMRKKDLHFLFRFAYSASYDDTLCENELDSVFIARRDRRLYANPAEVSGCRWLTLPELQEEMQQSPSRFTPWFHTIIKREELTGFLVKNVSL